MTFNLLGCFVGNAEVEVNVTLRIGFAIQVDKDTAFRWPCLKIFGSFDSPLISEAECVVFGCCKLVTLDELVRDASNTGLLLLVLSASRNNNFKKWLEFLKVWLLAHKYVINLPRWSAVACGFPSVSFAFQPSVAKSFGRRCSVVELLLPVALIIKKNFDCKNRRYPGRFSYDPPGLSVTFRILSVAFGFQGLDVIDEDEWFWIWNVELVALWISGNPIVRKEKKWSNTN